MQEDAPGLGRGDRGSGREGCAGQSDAAQGGARSEHGPPARAARLRDSHERTVMHGCVPRGVMVAAPGKNSPGIHLARTELAGTHASVGARVSSPG